MPSTRHQTLTDQATRVVAVATVTGLAALAGWISYRHMLLLARRAGQYGIDAHAFPLTVDGLDLIGVLVLLADRRTGRPSGWLPWTVLTVGTLASISANIAVAPNNPVARAISGWSAVALLAAAKMLAHLFEPTEPFDLSVAMTATDTATTDDPHPDPDSQRDEASSRVDERGERDHGRPTAAARRMPTSPAARARWQHIWQATKQHPAATADAAASHGVSLRTLQFIRAAGEHGHLDPPSQPGQQPGVDTADESPPPAADEPASGRHGALSGTPT